MAKAGKERFVSIGVGMGDAFFLQKGDHSVLVDGGKAEREFPVQFQRVIRRSCADVLVCTHNDADHANGILGFLRAGLTCNEVWLPGIWTDRLEDLLSHPEEFMDELILNVLETEDEDNKTLSLLDKLEAQYSEMEEWEDREKGEVADADVLHMAFEKAAQREAFWSIVSWLPFSWLLQKKSSKFWRIFHGSQAQYRLLSQAVFAAARIREIALSAYHSGTTIRWFEYDRKSSFGGIADFLIPLNAREIFQIRQRRWTALQFLALTKSNKESLVFLSPQNDTEPAVLFSADSDLSFSQKIPWSASMIVTAPHHGSEANANAYKRFQRDTRNKYRAFWVRSDGRFRSRPGPTYLGTASRFCTLCRNSKYPKQNVRMVVNSGRWQPLFTKKCVCT